MLVISGLQKTLISTNAPMGAKLFSSLIRMHSSAVAGSDVTLFFSFFLFFCLTTRAHLKDQAPGD